MEPHELENRRRSLAMLRRGQPSGLDRDEAIDLIEQLQAAREEARDLRAQIEQRRG